MEDNININFKKKDNYEVGDLFMGQRLFWKLPLSRSVIYLKRTKKRYDKFFLFLISVLAIFGWIALVL
jgi:hypothetical protein